MKKLSVMCAAVAVVAMLSPAANAQPGGRGGNAGGGFVERLMSFDKNKDGKLSKAELPERMQAVITKHDANKDGVLDKAELQKMAAAFGGGGGNGRQPRQPGPGPGGRPGGFGPGGPGGFGPPGGRFPGGRRPGGRGPGGRGGPPSPEEMVKHAMTFDADKDGKLSKAELLKFAQSMARRGPGGPGGRPGGREGRPGGRRPGGEGGNRPNRPNRPARPDA